MVDVPTLQRVPLADALAALPGATVFASPSALAALPAGRRTVTTRSLEELALDALVRDEGRHGTTDVVGVGGGTALDTAKYVALCTGKDVTLVPTSVGSLAPFTTEAARRTRRQINWAGDISPRVVIDPDLLATAPADRNRAGVAEVVSTWPATWDWRLADTRGRGVPLSTDLVELGASCRSVLSEAADELAAGTPAGIAVLVDVLARLGRACTDAGHRRLVDGSEHTFAQAFEHRLQHPAAYGSLVGLGSVAMSALQAWFGLSAGGPVDPADTVDLLSRCGVVANPHQLGIDEGTFRGVLRHTVRFAVGEFLPYSVLNEADVNASTAEEMWRWCWRVPIIGD
jgi:glycerol dehydrogenase-like iron-containing ADH family enzyme